MTATPEASGPLRQLDPAPPPPPPRSRAQTLIRGSSWRIVAQVMPLFVNLALTPYVITTLGRVGYGLWLVTSTLTQFIAHFDGGIGRSAQQAFAVLGGRNDKEGMTRLLVTLSAVAVAILAVTMVPAFVIAPSLARFFNAPDAFVDDTVFLLRILLVLIALGLLRNLFASVLHAYERFGLSSMSILAGYVVYAAGMVLTLANGMGLRGVAYAFIAQAVVATLLVVPSALAHLVPAGVGFVPWSRLVEFIKVSWRVQVSGLLTIASMQGVILIVGRLRPLQVSDFGPGTTFAQQLKMIPMNAVAPVQALLGRAVGAKGEAGATTDFVHVQQMWVRAVTGWVVVGTPAAYVGVNVWLPLEGNLAGTVAAVMLAAQWLSLLPQVILQWLLILGRPQHEMWSSALTVLGVVAVSVALVPVVGVIGAAIGAVVGHLAGFVLLLVASRSLPTPVRSPLADVPWWQALVAGSLSLFLVLGAGRLVTLGYLPEGGLGLLACGAAAAPALLVYAVITWGPRRVLAVVTARVRRGAR